ncbi:MAG: glycosyltransferase family 2 protein [Lachnospiraceae bacterium]|nr:glycosyltransferase family 2 protein [Lachnospiraceae bacterium]
MNEKISIIVPVYNVDKYLEVCIDSIINQTYKNIEIILVDDGSTDKSGRICDEYAKKDDRICVIHQVNQGLSKARNIGFSASTGVYIAFVDSDDFISPVYIETLYKIILRYNADISVCEYTQEQNDIDTKYLPDNNKEYKKDAVTMLRQWHGKLKQIETVAWNKLYKREILESMSPEIFPTGKTHEDVYTSHLFVEKASGIAITNRKLYYYRKRDNSISRKRTKESIRQDLEAQQARLLYFKSKKMYVAYVRLWIGHILHRMMYVCQKK